MSKAPLRHTLAMALVSTANQIRALSAFHLFLAYTLIFSPELLERQSIIYFFGQAMGVVGFPSLIEDNVLLADHDSLISRILRTNRRVQQLHSLASCLPISV